MHLCELKRSSLRSIFLIKLKRLTSSGLSDAQNTDRLQIAIKNTIVVESNCKKHLTATPAMGGIPRYTSRVWLKTFSGNHPQISACSLLTPQMARC